MANLPTGTVTFLFTDIEGSTRLWEQHPEAMREAVARHDALAADLIAQHGGSLVKSRGEGDSLFAVFTRATDAVAAAGALQQALVAEPWPVETPLRVRVALYTGEAELRDGDYYGAAVNRCARLRAAAHGEQVLLSAATREMVADALPPECSLRDLGPHRLRDLQRPEQVFQLLHPNLCADFPSLVSLDALPNNLPQQLTSFIGREREIQEIRRLLGTTRLLTLTGAGGTGKTRLALQVAADLVQEFVDGVWLVELAALSDPALVPRSVASTLGVRDEPGRPVIQSLADYLRPRSLLLLLDNCEHLLSACAQLAESLLQRCPNMRILATSREGLGLTGEQTYRVPSLSAPDPRQLPPLERLGEYEAVGLFTDRACLSQPDFRVTRGNAAAVAQVCCRLDGIPLAIELAAARVRALSVERIAERLDDCFRLLAGGSRTALPRHQTLRALIDWSYELLSEPERILLRRLSVFAGGWTLEAAEAVCGDQGAECWVLGAGDRASSQHSAPSTQYPAPDVLDLLTSLVDKSLVVYEEREEEDRYRLLETIRHYARDRLLASGEAATVRGRHLDWVVALAERAGPELFRREQAAWLQRLEREHDNLRAALDWSRESGEVEAGLRIGGAVWRFWHIRYHLAEGREGLAAVLSRPEASQRTRARARALDGAGVLAIRDRDFAGARSHYEEMLAIGRELGDKQIMAVALNGLGHGPLQQGDNEQARCLLEQGLTLAQEAGDRWEVAFSLHALGIVAAQQGDHGAAWSLYDEALVLRRELGDKWSVFFTLDVMANLAIRQGDLRRAQVLYGEMLAIARELGGRGLGGALYGLGRVARLQGDYAGARAHFEERVVIARAARDQRVLADALSDLGHAALEQGDLAAARSLLKESLAIWRELGDPGATWPLRLLGDVARYQGDYSAACSLYDEALALWRDQRETPAKKRAIARLLINLGMVVQKQGDDQRAAALCQESLMLYREAGEKDRNPEAVLFLEAWGSLAGSQGQPARAARLLGAASALREAMGAPLPPVDRAEYEGSVAAAQATLGEEAFTAAWATGRAMAPEHALAYALEQSTDG